MYNYLLIKTNLQIISVAGPEDVCCHLDQPGQYGGDGQPGPHSHHSYQETTEKVLKV